MADDDLYPSRDDVRAFVRALGHLIGRTGPPNEPPGFAAAVEAGEDWVGVEVVANWCALEAVLEAIPETTIPLPVAADEFRPFLWWAEVSGPIVRGREVVRGVADRWEVAARFDAMATDGGPTWATSRHLRGFIRLGGDRRARRAFPVPAIGPDEYAVLAWAHGRLARALEGDGTAPPSRLVEAMAGPARFVLGDPAGLPTCDGVTLEPLSARQRNAVRALDEAGPEGLDTAGLISASGEDHPVRVLRELREPRKGRTPRGDHPAWQRLILMSGARHSNYRLNVVWPEKNEENPRRGNPR